MCRWPAACVIVAAGSASGCGRVPVEVAGRFEPAHRPAVDIRIVLQAEHRGHASRYLAAAVTSLTTLTGWIGPYPHASLILADPPWQVPAAIESPAIVMDRAPWWASPTSMAPELATARAIARRVWSESIDTGGLPPWFTEGLVEYSARRSVAPLFQGENLGDGFAMIELRYFGGFVPRFIRIRLQPDADGDPLTAYAECPRVGGAPPSTLREVRSLTAKTVLTLNTLERWLGQPAFDAVLAEFVRDSRGRRPTLDDLLRTGSATSGQDLAWLLTPAFESAAVFDYAVSDLRSVAASEGGFDTTVVIARLGDGQFTGASAPRVGPYDSGRGIMVVVAFADGERGVETWDGRDAQKTFRYRSAARAVSAQVDPDRRVLLDVARINNSLTVTPRTGTAATRWSLRWMTWLEQVLLNCGVFV